MNTQERETDPLSDDQLDTVSGGTGPRPQPPFDIVKWVLAHLLGGPVRI